MRNVGVENVVKTIVFRVIPMTTLLGILTSCGDLNSQENAQENNPGYNPHVPIEDIEATSKWDTYTLTVPANCTPIGIAEELGIDLEDIKAWNPDKLHENRDLMWYKGQTFQVPVYGDHEKILERFIYLSSK